MAETHVGLAQRPKAGESVSGDGVVVVADGPRKLIGIVDGAGHGPQAAAVAGLFVSFVTAHAAEPLDAIFTGAHAALAGSRGAAATLLRVDEDASQLEFAGVGNVNLVARAAAPIHPVPQAGILGRRCRTVRVLPFTVARGDTLVLFTDGVSSRFDLAAFLHLDPEAMARAIVAAHGADHDDATCIALQFA
jgi:phosphoserine phosphatase RsbX